MTDKPTDQDVEKVARVMATLEKRDPDEVLVAGEDTTSGKPCVMWQRYVPEAWRQLEAINAERGQAILTALGYSRAVTVTPI